MSLFEVLGHFQLHILTAPDSVVFNPCFNLSKSAAGSQSAHDLIRGSQEDADKASAHGKVIVFEGVPFGLRLQRLESRCVYNYFVSVEFGRVARTVCRTHLIEAALDERCAFVID